MSTSDIHLTTINPPVDPLFVADPLASPSGRFALARPAGRPAPDQPSPEGLRPWGLRRMGPVALPAGRLAGWRYDPVQQVSLGPDGTPIAASASAAGTANTTGSPGRDDPTGVLVAGPPTAPTTSTVDGEDPPSSEDWINDYCQDDQP
ncbi:MAG: putative ATP-grasp-modified RiPP [Sciscionella sp.]